MTTASIFLSPIATGTFCDTADLVDGSYIPGAGILPADLAWTALDDATDAPDDDSTFARLRSQQRISLKMPKLSVLGITTDNIISIQATFRIKEQAAGGGTPTTTAFIYQANQLTLDSIVHTTTTSYQNKSSTLWTFNPGTGLAWSPADLEAQAIEFGLVRGGSGGKGISWTSFYLTMVYNPAVWGRISSAAGNWAASGAASSGWQPLPTTSKTWTRE